MSVWEIPRLVARTKGCTVDHYVLCLMSHFIFLSSLPSEYLKGDKLFSRACCSRTRVNGFKLKQGRFRVDIRKKFTALKVVRHWPRLPREVVDAPSLETFKARLDRALSNLIELKMSLLMAGGLDWMAFKGRFQPKPFQDSAIYPFNLSCPKT